MSGQHHYRDLLGVGDLQQYIPIDPHYVQDRHVEMLGLQLAPGLFKCGCLNQFAHGKELRQRFEDIGFIVNNKDFLVLQKTLFHGSYSFHPLSGTTISANPVTLVFVSPRARHVSVIKKTRDLAPQNMLFVFAASFGIS